MNFDSKKIKLVFWILVGIALRFFAMTLGHNSDFEAYCTVGKLVNSGKNVYAETHLYNYGPIFLCIQGSCWWVAKQFGVNCILIFRILIVGILTLTDMGIMWWLIKRYTINLGLIFFLNPVSIFITGFHNQFDNIAVFLGLLCVFFYNEEKKITGKDLCFVIIMSCCLITKHIFFCFPFWILVKKGLPIMKRCLYSFIPPVLFLLSFVPFCIGNTDAFNGMVDHVFLYRSINNSPLLRIVYEVLNVPNSFYFFVYLGFLLLIPILFRKKSYEYLTILYLISMVTFASAVANQYLIIPIVALCIFSKGICRNFYFLYAAIFLLLNDCGLNLASKIVFFQNPQYDFIRSLLSGGAAYTILMGILFIVIIKECIILLSNEKKDNLMIQKFLEAKVIKYL